MDAFGQAKEVTSGVDHRISSARLTAAVAVTDRATPDQSAFPIALDLTRRGYGQTVHTSDGDGSHTRGGVGQPHPLQRR